MTQPRILIVDDDVFLLELLATCLRNESYDVSVAKNGREMHMALEKSDIDLILLDLTLPDEDGLALARQLRTRSSVPIIVLTAREDRENRIAALEIGADDYLTKPCDVEELILRVRNILGRAGGGAPSEGGEVISFNGWSLDISAGNLTSPKGKDVILQRSEFNLLAAMARAPNRVLTRAFLLDAISRGEASASERMIDVLISRLRKRLEKDSGKPRLIITVAGRGYKFTPDSA